MTKPFKFPSNLAIFFCFALLLLFPRAALGQLTNVTDQTSTPVPGSGHDYFKMVSEAPNPANGSVSIRIQLPVPPGRQLTLPFAIGYDSNGVAFFQALANASGGWASDQRTFAKGGWHLTVPQISDVHTQRASGQQGQYTCQYYTGYMFYDAGGVRHPLNLAYVPSPNSSGCLNQSKQLFSYLSGNDEFDKATWSSFHQTVSEPNGTKYSFTQLDGNSNNGSYSALPASVEDRNGNLLNFNWSVGSTSFTMTDTVGRTAVSASNFGSSGGTVTVFGLSPYTLQWTTVHTNYSVYANPISSNGGCGPVLGVGETLPVVSSITLPNNEEYTFQYDSAYGRISQITYPSGGWIKYTWGLTDTLSEAVVYPNTSGVDQACQFQMYAPVIRSREVSFDGQNVALTQNFTYNTTWNTQIPSLWAGKTTTVTSTDNVRNLSSTAIYAYIPWYSPAPPNETSTFNEQIPVENIVTYKDWDGTVKRTETKGWTGYWADLLTSERVGLDGGLTSETDYSYAGFGQIQEKDEYDYGSSPHGPLSRKTVINYDNFSSIGVFDRPGSVIVYDGSSNRVAETDYNYDATAPSSAGITVGRDPTYNGNTSVARGNATSMSKWVNTSGSSLTWNYTYDDTGQKLSMSDPKTNQTTYSYADQNADLAQITYPAANGLPHAVSFTYNLADGQLATSKDENGQTTNYYYGQNGELLDRLTSIVYPDTGSTTYSYTSICGQPSTTAISLSGNSNYVTTATPDGVCHVTQTAITSDSQPDYTDTTYDGMGKVRTVSNPYRSQSEVTYGLTTYTYDALGRVSDRGSTKSIVYPDGSTTGTIYSGNSTTVTDAAGKPRTLVSDALGRVTSVNEAGLYSTTYTYNALDDLLSVTQGSQLPCMSGTTAVSRSFTYDSVGRLVNACNPESGTTNYSYPTSNTGACSGDPSDVCTRTDARGITTTYTYNDSLNRLTSKTYSDGTPTATFSYDLTNVWGDSTTNAVGRLVLAQTLSGSTLLTGNAFETYDPMGRPKVYRQCTPYNCGTSDWRTTYNYDLGGDVTSWTHPAGFSITQTINGARQISQITSSLNDSYDPASLATATYTPFGSVSTLLNGCVGSGCTSLQESYFYNKRLQPAVVELGTSSNHSADSCRVYNYYVGVANASACSESSSAWPQGSNNNGDVAGYYFIDSYNYALSHAAVYNYDTVNRLIQATATPDSGNGGIVSYNKTYTYTGDGSNGQYGNMNCSTAGPGCLTLTYSATSNHITTSGYAYDLAGNLTGDGTNTYQWDAEGRLTKVINGAGTAISTNTYNALGQRVRDVTPSATTDEAYGAGGNLLWRYTGNSSTNRSFVPVNGRIVAEYYSGGTLFDHPDELGSIGQASNYTGSVYNELLFYPYGEVWTGSTGCWDCSIVMHQTFAQLPDYDAETDQYNTLARHYTPQGRWLSPDPGGLKAVHPDDPQTWNMYAYVRNNPTTFVDPEGEAIELTCGNSDGDTCTRERQKELAALQNAVGAQAGAYLYDNVDKSGDHYVGIYTNGPNGNGPSFESLGDAASALGGIINDTRVAQLSVVPAGTQVTDPEYGGTRTIGTANVDTGVAPGATTANSSSAQVYILDWTKTSLGSLPQTRAIWTRTQLLDF